MSRLREKAWAQIAAQYLTLLLLSGGLTLTALSALLPGLSLWPALIGCALFSMVFYLLFSIRLRFKFLLPLLIIGGLTLWGLSGGGPVFTLIQLAKAAFLVFRGVPQAIAPYADAARLTLCLIFSLISAALIWDEYLSLAIFLTAVITGLSFILGGSEMALLYSLPAVVAILMMTPPDKRRRFIALPVAAVLALTAYLITPHNPKTDPSMEKTAQDIRNLVEDYLLYDDYRSSFSLAQTGYQPLETKLGGPAEPTNIPVMEVKTDRKIHLRGKAYDSYTGLSWLDTLSHRRYLYFSPRFQTLRDETLDLARPLRGAESIPEETAQVHLLNDGSTTLFVPQRTRTLETESERMVLYYNLGSELFITRDTAAGDTYSFTYLPFAPENGATLDIVEACQGIPDPNYDQIAQTYLALPGHIQKEIHDLTALATQGAQTPYEKALAIETFLRTHYRYDLDVEAPPEDVDFVAWFLIGQRKGYCTYFATAMTVMCRLAGVPARYVTGYLAVPDENNLAYVTGEYAHAWTEVYLNGFGWLTFDATPRSDNDRDSHGETPPPGEEDPPQGDLPTPSPSPSAQPSPSPDPENEEEESPEESPDPEEEASPSPQPLATPTPPPNAQPSPRPEQVEEAGGDPPYWLFILLAILLIIALAVWRFLSTEPVRKATRHPSRAAHIYFDGICGLMERQGVRRLPQETLHDFARKGEKLLPGFADLVDAYAAQVYGPYLMHEGPLQEMYLALRAQASPLSRFMLAWKRMMGK